MVLTYPWTKLDLYLGGWVGTEFFWCCSRQNLESSDDGRLNGKASGFVSFSFRFVSLFL